MRRTALCLAAGVGGACLVPLAVGAAQPGDVLKAIPTPQASPTTLQCSVTFNPSALKRKRGYERRKNPAARALARFLRRGEAEEIGQPSRGWFAVGREGRYIEFLAGRGPEYGSMTFEKRRGKWRWAGSGGCEPRAYRRRALAASWALAAAPAADATTLSVDVSEEGCHGFDDSNGYVLRPRVHYGRREITLTFHTKPRKGIQTCPDPGPTRMSVVLDQPVGARSFRDGSFYPTRRAKAPR